MKRVKRIGMALIAPGMLVAMLLTVSALLAGVALCMGLGRLVRAIGRRLWGATS